MDEWKNGWMDNQLILHFVDYLYEKCFFMEQNSTPQSSIWNYHLVAEFDLLN